MSDDVEDTSVLRARVMEETSPEGLLRAELKGLLGVDTARRGADVDRLIGHSVQLNTIGWRIAKALGDVPEGAVEVDADPVALADRLIAEVVRLRAEMAAEYQRGKDDLTEAAGKSESLHAWCRGRTDRLVTALADCVVKATEYGVQDGDFVANYILPTGPLHRAIPLLQEEHDITVRPGFDGRTFVRPDLAQPTGHADQHEKGDGNV